MTASNKTLELEVFQAALNGLKRAGVKDTLRFEESWRRDLEANYISKDAVVRAIPEKRKVPSFSLRSSSKNPADVAMAFDGGYNQAISDTISALKLDVKASNA